MIHVLLYTRRFGGQSSTKPKYRRWLGAALTLFVGMVSMAGHEARAGVISVDDPTYGAGAFTLDQATGLSFLDVTISQGQSFNQVSSGFGAGGEFAGLRYATSAEVFTLFTDAGITTINKGSTFNPTAITAIGALQGLVGVTVPGSNLLTFGLTSDVGNTALGPRHAESQLSDSLFSQNASAFTGLVSEDNPADDQADFSSGSWLVRNAAGTPPTDVPEPPALAIFAAGLALLAWRARNRARTL